MSIGYVNSPTVVDSAPCRAGLVLELRHPARLAEPGDGVEHPGQLRMCGHMRLHEQRGGGRVDAGSDVLRRRAPSVLAQLRRILRDGDRVQVDDAEYPSNSDCSLFHCSSAPM